MKATTAHRIPGPPELLPGRPDAIVDLRTAEGAALVGARWRCARASIVDIDGVDVGDDLGPSGPPNRTQDITPHAEAVDFDDSAWRELEPAQLELRLGSGRVCFNWYRTRVTLPMRIGDLDVRGATIVFEIAIDDYAEVWIDGQLCKSLGDVGGGVVAGFNAPNRVVLTRDAQPGQTFTIAVLGINGPISSSPANYIWVRTATLDCYAANRATVAERAMFALERRAPQLDRVVPPSTTLERVATGFDFTEGPLWHDGALLFSSPNTNAVYRWSPNGTLTVFRSKSGYTGVDIGRYHQPGSNGLALDPAGRLVICQHGNRRVIRVNSHGDITVVADRFDGRRLNSPNDLVFHSTGTLYFTDPPFGLPESYDDPKKELPWSGVYAVTPAGEITLVTSALRGPNGIALSPDQRFLYVGDWDAEHSAIVRFELDEDGRASHPTDWCDLTGERAGWDDDSIDGLAVDTDGNVFVCGPGGLWVISSNAQILGRVVLPEAPHNVTWGDHDARTLYVTAMSSIYRLRLPAGARAS